MSRSPRVVPAAALLVLACTAGDPIDVPDVASDRGLWSGELRSYVVNRKDHTALVHKLRTSDGRLLALDFGRHEAPPPGTSLRIRGQLRGETIEVSGHDVLARSLPGTLEQIPGALIDGAKKPTRRWAFVLLDVNGGGNPINKENAQQVLFSPDRVDSIRSYFREVSHGVQDIEGQVFGPLPYTMNGCDTDELARDLRPQIPGSFDQYLWFFGTQQEACDWAGIAELGRAERPTRHSWYNSFHSCTILVQEPGHNFGMVHSSAARCTLDGRPVPIAFTEQDGDPECQHVEYGNPFDPMGGGDCFHMTGVQKAYQEWISGCNVVRATESGTFTLYPLESSCNGLQLLQVPFPEPRTLGSAVMSGYYLELRAPLGRDGRLSPRVLVVMGNDVREARNTGNRNWLLDMTPETMSLSDAALPVGKTFEDPLPGGPKFTVLSADAEKAVIRVELSTSNADPAAPGVGTCRDLTRFTAPGPDACVAPAAQPGRPAPVDAGAGAGAVDAGAGGSGGSGSGGGTAGGEGGSGGETGAQGGQGGSAGASETAGSEGAAGGRGGSRPGAGRGGSAGTPGDAPTKTNPSETGAGGCAVDAGVRGRGSASVGLVLMWLVGRGARRLRRRRGAPSDSP